MSVEATDTLIIGAGIVGISTAYYLKRMAPNLGVTLVEMGQPMALTSAQSGENYRNWWPHPVMKRFTDHSIDLMEEIARDTENRINMTRRGYVLATRHTNIDGLLEELLAGYGGDADGNIRDHDAAGKNAYRPPLLEDWESAPTGVDVLRSEKLIKEQFPWYDPEIRALLHIRRGGAISGQQMGQYMLERFRDWGGRRLQAKVVAIDKPSGFVVTLENNDNGASETLRAVRIINAAGPFLNHIAGMLDVHLPVTNVLQQKIAFEDTRGTIPRRMPFSIDLDGQSLDWTQEEREFLSEEPEFAELTKQMPGGIHCRPDGGDRGSWIKLGWAFNKTSSRESLEPPLDDKFPEIVLRGAARLNPSLKAYYGGFPRNMVHYAGYYTMTTENWPLIGPMGVDGASGNDAFVCGAMSGFGTMSACASGELCAKWLLGDKLPSYAAALSPSRYEDEALMAGLRAQENKGVL